MKKRTISAFFIVLILTISILLGNTVFAITMGICAILGINELVNSNKNIIKKNNMKTLSIINVLLLCLNNIFFKFDYLIIISFILLSFLIPIVLYNDEKKYNIIDAMFLLGSTLLIGMAFNNLILFREKDIFLCIYIFLISFMTDTYAYIGGRLIGKTKLISISPKKTVEGSIVGTIMATLIGSVFYNVLINDVNLTLVIFVSLLLSVISQLGDLFFSSIKRYFDIKDYSNVIPGHGGILDRFDSVIFVTLLLKILIGIV